MLCWKIGDVRITRMQELEAPGPKGLVPDSTVESPKAIDWIRPFVGPDGRPVASVNALAIETSGPALVVDARVGDDRERSVPVWNGLQSHSLEGHGDHRLAVSRADCASTHPSLFALAVARLAAPFQPALPPKVERWRLEPILGERGGTPGRHEHRASGPTRVSRPGAGQPRAGP